MRLFMSDRKGTQLRGGVLDSWRSNSMELARGIWGCFFTGQSIGRQVGRQTDGWEMDAPKESQI